MQFENYRFVKEKFLWLNCQKKKKSYDEKFEDRTGKEVYFE